MFSLRDVYLERLLTNLKLLRNCVGHSLNEGNLINTILTRVFRTGYIKKHCGIEKVSCCYKQTAPKK